VDARLVEHRVGHEMEGEELPATRRSLSVGDIRHRRLGFTCSRMVSRSNVSERLKDERWAWPTLRRL